MKVYENCMNYSDIEENLEQDILHYGTIITDDSFAEFHACTRIRTILYDGKIYYHKMVDGNVDKFMVIGKVEQEISQEDKDKVEMEIYNKIRRQFDWGR